MPLILEFIKSINKYGDDSPGPIITSEVEQEINNSIMEKCGDMEDDYYYLKLIIKRLEQRINELHDALNDIMTDSPTIESKIKAKRVINEYAIVMNHSLHDFAIVDKVFTLSFITKLNIKRWLLYGSIILVNLYKKLKSFQSTDYAPVFNIRDYVVEKCNKSNNRDDPRGDNSCDNNSNIRKLHLKQLLPSCLFSSKGAIKEDECVNKSNINKDVACIMHNVVMRYKKADGRESTCSITPRDVMSWFGARKQLDAEEYADKLEKIKYMKQIDAMSQLPCELLNKITLDYCNSFQLIEIPFADCNDRQIEEYIDAYLKKIAGELIVDSSILKRHLCRLKEQAICDGLL